MTSHLMPALLTLALLATSALTAEPPGSPILPPATVVPPEVHEISPEQVTRQLVDHPDTVIIDVRTEDERHTRGYILNSLHHDYFHGQQTLDALAKLDKSKPCIVHCAIGGRAQLIAIEMHKLGFKNLLLLKGGFNAWTASGQAIAR
ncbi:rhodanese-like domain-containing protein [Prosthecobacter sp.]|uniref:rhodanese-like domain-containing protein n=1 Tax=Prosthecobacter sp. TaxID=1965333 RepID=UPI003784B547